MMFEEEIDCIVEKIANDFDPKAIIVFGSVAKGTATLDSDIDLMVILETDLSHRERVLEIRKSIGVNSVPLDLLAFTPEEVEEGKKMKNSIISEALRTGRIVYGTA